MTQSKYSVGSVVRLKVNLLGESIGDFGICYECYELGNGQGRSFVFEKGGYDGFSLDEQEKMFEHIKDTNFNYIFDNVRTLKIDFRAHIKSLLQKYRREYEMKKTRNDSQNLNLLRTADETKIDKTSVQRHCEKTSQNRSTEEGQKVSLQKSENSI
jgi:hypothetical protein